MSDNEETNKLLLKIYNRLEIVVLLLLWIMSLMTGYIIREIN